MTAGAVKLGKVGLGRVSVGQVKTGPMRLKRIGRRRERLGDTVGSLHNLMKNVKMMRKCCFTSTETVDLLGTGAQVGHLDFHTAPEL